MVSIKFIYDDVVDIANHNKVRSALITDGGGNKGIRFFCWDLELIIKFMFKEDRIVTSVISTASKEIFDSFNNNSVGSVMFKTKADAIAYDKKLIEDIEKFIKFSNTEKEATGDFSDHNDYTHGEYDENCLKWYLFKLLLSNLTSKKYEDYFANIYGTEMNIGQELLNMLVAQMLYQKQQGLSSYESTMLSIAYVLTDKYAKHMGLNVE